MEININRELTYKLDAIRGNKSRQRYLIDLLADHIQQLENQGTHVPTNPYLKGKQNATKEKDNISN